MRWNLKRAKMLFALIPAISIVFFILTSNNNIFADQSFAAFDIYMQICDAAQPEEGKNSPRDYDAAQNFAIAADVYNNTDSVQGTITGTVNALGGFYTQKVQNYHAKTAGHIFTESISLSAIASVAEQRYFKDGALLYRKGETSGSTVTGWASGVTELAPAVYRQRYGIVPQEISKYSVTSGNGEKEGSIISGSLVSENADGTFTYELILNGELAQKYSRYEMMTFAGVTEYPTFYSCRMVYTIDSAWRILEVKNFDTYDIAVMNGIRCESSLTEIFSYEEGYMPERAKIFADYVPTGNTGNVDVQKGPSEYLSEAFGDYISGVKPLKLTAKAELLGETLDIAAAIDIKNNDFRFKIGEDIFAAYSGSEIFLSLGESKVRAAVSDLSPLLSSLGIDLGGFGFDASILDKLFANHTIEETDTHVHILMPFELTGIKLNVDMGLIKLENGKTAADTITAEITAGSVNIDAAIQITDSVSLPELDKSEYVSISPLLGSIADTLSQKAFCADIAVLLQTDNAAESISGKINVNLNNGTQIWGELGLSGITAEFAYADNAVYLGAGNIKLMLPLSDAHSLSDSVNEIFGSMDEFAQNVAPLLGKETADKIVAALDTVNDAISSLKNGDTSALLDKLNFILPELGVNSILKLLCGAEITQNSVKLPITAANGNAFDISLKTDGNYISELSLSGLELFGVKADLNAALTFGDNGNANVKPDDYVNILALKPVLDALPALLKSDKFNLEITDGYLGTSAISGELNGKIQLSLSPLSVTGKLEFRGKHDIAFKFENETIYAAINDLRVKLALSDINSIADKIAALIPPKTQDGAAVGDAAYSAIKAAGIIQNALGGKTLADILSYVTGFTQNGNCGVTVSFAFGDFAADIAISANANALVLDAYNISYGDALKNSRIKASLSPALSVDSFAFDTATFCDLAAVSDYVAPVFDTLDEKYFNVAFDGSVLDSRNSAITVNGELKVRVTEGFADIYAQVSLGGKTGEQNIKVYLIDGTDYSTENAKFDAYKLRAYLDYNGFIATIDYESVLRIVGALSDILNIKSDLIDNLVKDVYNESLDPSVFETLNIAGLDSIRDALNSVLGAADGGLSSILGTAADKMLDSVLAGVSLGFNEDGFLEIGVNNAVFNPFDTGKAIITLGHDGKLLTHASISNLSVNGNVVDFNARLDCQAFEFPAEPTENVKDFSSIDELLISVIKTASLREFEITGKIKLNLLGMIKPEIPFDVKVKILSDGSTVAAVKLEVPYVMFGMLKRTDSYIYFANDMLYFVVDVWDNGAFGAGNYKNTEFKSATPEEFLANPVDYLFFLLRMSDSIQSPIKNAMTGSSGGTPSADLNQILKAYSYNEQNGAFNLKLGLKELTGSKDLNDVNINLYTTDGYVSGFALDTKFTDMNITLALENTVLSNLNVQDGKVLGANKLANVSFGKSAAQLGGSIDNLEDYLAVLFPVEAAQTLGKKAEHKADLANAAAQKAGESVKAAQHAVDAARSAYLYANKAAEYAEKAAALRTERGYAAAGSAALGSIKAVSATVNAVNEAIIAAQNAGDEGAQTLENANALRNEILESISSVAAKAATAANAACAESIKVAGETVRAAVQKADSAQSANNYADWFEAAALAGETLSAIETVNTASRAASLAAAISGDQSLITQAEQNAASASEISADYAGKAANVAINSADAISERGKAIAQNAYENAQNSAYEPASASITEALEYARAALQAANSAKSAALLAVNEQTSNEAQAAADNAAQAALIIGDKLLDTCSHAVTALYGSVSGKDDSRASLESSQSELKTVSEFANLAAQAKPYAGENGATRLKEIYRIAADCANATLARANKVLHELAESAASALTQTVSQIGSQSYGTGDYDKIKDHAAKLSSAADGFDSAIFTLTESTLSTANAIYSAALPLLDETAKEKARALLFETLNGGNTVTGAFDSLDSAISSAQAAANRVCEYSEKLKAPWYDAAGLFTVKPAKEAATAARDKINNINAAADSAASAIDSLRSLYKSLFA